MDEQTETRAAANVSRPGRSPIVVFVVLLALVLAVAVGAVVTRKSPEADATAPPIEHTNFALTDAEAIARFKELNSLLLRSYRRRDVSLVDTYLVPDSPLYKRAVQEIDKLLSDGVRDKAVFEGEVDRVLSSSPDSIVIRHRTIEYPHFVSENGRDVTASPHPIVEIVDWTMRQDSGTWRLFNSRPIRSWRYRGSNA